jgi:hypothetical protein
LQSLRTSAGRLYPRSTQSSIENAIDDFFDKGLLFHEGKDVVGLSIEANSV